MPFIMFLPYIKSEMNWIHGMPTSWGQGWLTLSKAYNSLSQHTFPVLSPSFPKRTASVNPVASIAPRRIFPIH